MQQIIKIKTNEKYQITGDNLKIFVEKHLDKGTLSIATNKNKDEFVFKNSKPETIKRIAELLAKAAGV